jgi:hypothetical protein
LTMVRAQRCMWRRFGQLPSHIARWMVIRGPSRV